MDIKKDWLKRYGNSFKNDDGESVRYPAKRTLRREDEMRNWYGKDFAINEIAEQRMDFSSLSKDIEGLIKDIKKNANTGLVEVTENWVKIIGNNMLASKLKPKEVKNNCLFIKVLDSSSLFFITREKTLQQKLLKEISKFCGNNITELRFIP